MPRTSPQLTCPRCGYDVSGVVPTWADACPLEGRCSECGLGFAWVDIYRPERLYPAWSFEHVGVKRLRAFFRTLGIAVLPARFWREMPMSAPIRLLRLGMFVVFVSLLAHVMVFTLAIWQAYQGWMRYGWTTLRITRAKYWNEFLWTALNPYWSNGLWPSNGTWLLASPYMRLLVVWGVLIPLPYLILVDTMRRVKCRRVHLIRGWAYFVPVVLAAALVSVLLDRVPWFFARFSWTWSFQRWCDIASISLTLLLAAWYAAWWWRFTKFYLRLPQSVLVVCLLLVTSLLTTLALASVFDNQLIVRVGGVLNALFR